VTAELIYEPRRASTLLERVLKLLKDEYQRAGNAALFDSLKQLLPREPEAPSQKDTAQSGMTENAVRQAFYRFRQRYLSLLRQEIAHTVATPDKHFTGVECGQIAARTNLDNRRRMAGNQNGSQL
jgi:hypothetical protein